MRSKRTNKEAGKSILVMILDAYQEYVSFSYPKDPAVYVIRANPKTVTKLKELLAKGILTKKECPENWGFRIEEDSRLYLDEICFGPEQTCIYWSSKNELS